VLRSRFLRYATLWLTYPFLVPLAWVLDRVGFTRRWLRRGGPRPIWNPEGLAERFKRYQASGRDVFVCTYFKSGTNWALQIAHRIANRGGGDFEHIRDVVPWPEGRPGASIDLRDASIARTSPTGLRVVKTHLPWNRLPQHPDARYICVIRDPKDVFVSAYHFTHSGALGALMPSVSTWLEYFLSPHFHMGRWDVHTASFWAQRRRPNVLVLTYQELKEDLARAVRRIAGFMGVPLTPDEFDRVCRVSSFEFMRSIDHKFRPGRTTPLASGKARMIRKGLSGGSSELLSPAQQQTIDAHFAARLRELGSDFPYGDPIRIHEVLREARDLHSIRTLRIESRRGSGP
jgi:hypothetical protein